MGAVASVDAVERGGGAGGAWATVLLTEPRLAALDDGGPSERFTTKEIGKGTGLG